MSSHECTFQAALQRAGCKATLRMSGDCMSLSLGQRQCSIGSSILQKGNTT